MRYDITLFDSQPNYSAGYDIVGVLRFTAFAVTLISITIILRVVTAL
jgi:hypothetical protein